jgi:hypothetical protein
MKSLIPKYTYRGMESKLPSAGDKVGVAHPGKSACYSGGELPPRALQSKSDAQPSAQPDESAQNNSPKSPNAFPTTDG